MKTLPLILFALVSLILGTPELRAAEPIGYAVFREDTTVRFVDMSGLDLTRLPDAAPKVDMTYRRGDCLPVVARSATHARILAGGSLAAEVPLVRVAYVAPEPAAVDAAKVTTDRRMPDLLGAGGPLIAWVQAQGIRESGVQGNRESRDAANAAAAERGREQLRIWEIERLRREVEALKRR